MQEALETLARGCAAFERERQQWAEEKARLMTELASARAMHRAQCDATKKLAERVALLQGQQGDSEKITAVAGIQQPQPQPPPVAPQRKSFSKTKEILLKYLEEVGYKDVQVVEPPQPTIPDTESPLPPPSQRRHSSPACSGYTRATEFQAMARAQAEALQRELTREHDRAQHRLQDQERTLRRRIQAPLPPSPQQCEKEVPQEGGAIGTKQEDKEPNTPGTVSKSPHPPSRLTPTADEPVSSIVSPDPVTPRKSIDWNTTTTSDGGWRLLTTLYNHLDAVRRVRFHPQQKTLFSASDDGLVKMWNLGSSSAANGDPSWSFRGHIGPVLSIAVCAAQSSICTGGSDAFMPLWNIPPQKINPYSLSGSCRRFLVGYVGGEQGTGNTGPVYDLVFLSQPQRKSPLLAACADRVRAM
eukprot:TRINITY_DN622_c0_g1_i3.p1 TRINITY_DN622_c0_g1~~TRINITY_DN622_c0_g1_i3.p1  ORF type:complete len:426 (-),score=101.91 TRINITY_DN622_c0_g1_i3:831-2072(-)